MDCREEVALIQRRFKHLAGHRRFLRRPDGRAAARQVRRREAHGLGHCRGGRRCRDARVARARGAARRRRRGGQPAAVAARRVRRRAGLRSGGRLRRLAPRRSCPRALFAIALAAGLPLTVPKAWRSLRLRFARHQRADAHRPSSARSRSASGPKARRWCSCSPSRRRSRRARSSAHERPCVR